MQKSWFVIFLIKLTFLSVICAQKSFKDAQKQNKKAWRDMNLVLKKIVLPKIPNKTYFVKDFRDLKEDFQKTINQVIISCNQSGGGKVIIPKGDYICKGSIFLLSNVHLVLEEGCYIRFSTNPTDYLPLVKVRWEGTVCYNYSPLVYAYQQKNIAISGKGTLDGQCENTWSLWKKGNEGKNQDVTKPIIRKMGAEGADEEQRKFGEGFYLRPSLIELFECENILLKDFTAKSSPFWTVHPVFSKNITIQNLIIRKGTTNDDGIDPDSCEDVLIEGCDIDTDDDPISIKAGRDQDAWKRKGSQNIVVRNCILRSNVGNAVCIGSEMSGGVQNVFVENCVVSKTDHVLNFKCNLDRGGYIRDIYVRNIKADSAKRAGILFQMDYHGYRGGNYPPDFKNFYLENISVKYIEKTAIKISGVETKKIINVYLNKFVVGKAENISEIKFLDNFIHNNIRINQQKVKF
jgi:polygalacturonase